MLIRIKGKHLLIFCAVLLATLLIITSFGGYILYPYARALDRMGYTEKANVYYSRISRISSNDIGILAEYQRLQNIIQEGNFRYSTTFSVITGDFITLSGFIGFKTVDDVNARYEALSRSNASSSKRMAEHTIATALVNWFGGRTDRAIALLEGLQPEDERLLALKRLHLANMYFYLGETEKSMEAITGMNPPAGLEGYREDIEILNRIFTGENKIEYAYPMIYQYEPYNCLEEPLKFTRSLIDELQSFRTKTMNGTTGNTLSGRITLEGKPQQNLMVFVKDAEYQNSWSSAVGRGDGLVGLGISDEQGYFEISGIPDGVYGITLYIPWQRITGKNITMHTDFDMVLKGNIKRVEDIALSAPIRLDVTEADGAVTFRWDEQQLPEGAWMMTLSELNESDQMVYRTNNNYNVQQSKGNELTLNIREAQKIAYQQVFSYGGEPDPMNYIEPLYHSGQYGYKLHGYQGSSMLHFSSEGIYPNQPPARLTIRGSEWTKEDRLLLDGKFEEARKGYEAVLEKDPDNIHALKVLSKMYDFGYILQDGESGLELGGKDKERALELLQRLDTLVGGRFIKSALAAQYEDLKQYTKAAEVLHDLQNTDPNPYNELQLGRLHLYMNRFSESVEYFQKYTQTTGNGTLYLFLPAFLMNDADLLTEGAGIYKTQIHTDLRDLVEAYNQMEKGEYGGFFEMVSQNRIEEAQRWLDGRNDELGLFLKAVFLLTQDNNGKGSEELDAAFRQYHRQIQNPEMDEILVYLGREFVSSAYGTPVDYPG